MPASCIQTACGLCAARHAARLARVIIRCVAVLRKGSRARKDHHLVDDAVVPGEGLVKYDVAQHGLTCRAGGGTVDHSTGSAAAGHGH